MKKLLEQDLGWYKIVERCVAIVCLAIPALLQLAYKPLSKFFNFPYSISSYAHKLNEKSYVFGMLLTMAAMLFLINGAIHYRSEVKNLKKGGKWYNMFLGLLIFFIILFPEPYTAGGVQKGSNLHIMFAVLFFLGSAYFIFKEARKKGDKIRIILSILVVLSFLPTIYLVIKGNRGNQLGLWLYLAEWFALAVICYHYIRETYAYNRNRNLLKGIGKDKTPFWGKDIVH